MMHTDWVSNPVDTLLDIAEERGLSMAELATALQLSDPTFNALIAGTFPLVYIVSKIVREFGGTHEFWCTRYVRYVMKKAELRNNS